MNTSEKKYENMILLLMNLIFIAFVYFIGYKDSLNSEWVFLVILFITLITTLVIFFRHQYEISVKKIITKINNEIKDIISGKKIITNNISSDDNLLPFYDNLKRLNLWVASKEDSYEDILKIVNSVALNMQLDKLLENILPKLLEATDSSCGAFYLVNNANNKLEIKNSIGFSKSIYKEFDLNVEEGFMGVSVADDEIKIIKDIPDDTIYLMRTFLGKVKPKNVMMIPIHDDKGFVAVLILSSIYNYNTTHIRTLNIVRSYIGVAISNALTFERTKRLSNELKFQNRLVQDLNDDLEKKVSDRTLFLKSIINAIEDYAIYTIDKNFTVTAWNKGAELVSGYTEQEIVGMPIDFVFRNQEFNILEMKKRMQLLDNESKIKESGWRKKKDGKMYYAETTIFKLFDEDGDTLGFTNVTKDITALKKAEDALWFERGLTQRILDCSPSGLVIVNTKGVIEAYNNNACKFLDASSLLGRNISDFFKEQQKFLVDLKYISEGNFLSELEFSLKNLDRVIEVKIVSIDEEKIPASKLLIQLNAVNCI